MLNTAHDAGHTVLGFAKHVLRYLDHQSRPAHPRHAPRSRRVAGAIARPGADDRSTESADRR